MYSHTKKWIHPQVEEKNRRLTERTRLNTARRKFCPRSPFFHANFDVLTHRLEWEAIRKRSQAERIAQRLHEATRRRRLGLPPPPRLRPAFDGRPFCDNCAAVTSWRTVFTPAYDNPRRSRDPTDPYDKEPGRWPCAAEMKYEGDERIATDPLHGRCLAAPRADDGVEQVNWMHRPIVAQYPLDDRHYPPPNEVEIWMRTHHVAELEISDEEGVLLLGRELMRLLDPGGKWAQVKGWIID